MSSYRETIYRGRDNEIPFALEQDGRLIDAAAVMRCQLVFKRQGSPNVTVDSQTQGGLFSFSEREIVRGRRTGILTLRLGALSQGDVPDGLYDVDVYLFDVSTAVGLYWDTIEVLVRGGDV